jgi:hypothetical protein
MVIFVLAKRGCEAVKLWPRSLEVPRVGSYWWALRTAESRQHFRTMQRFLCLLALVASASAFTAPVSRSLPVSRVSEPRAQFGTGNYDDSQSKPGFVLSPIAGGSKVCV